MNSVESQTAEITAVDTSAPYPNSVEGNLQYLVDISLAYQDEIKNAKTPFKREYYTKKLVKNNNKLYKLLVRTPNEFNPLMKYLRTQSPETATITTSDGQTMQVELPPAETDEDGNPIMRSGYSQVIDGDLV